MPKKAKELTALTVTRMVAVGKEATNRFGVFPNRQTYPLFRA